MSKNRTNTSTPVVHALTAGAMALPGLAGPAGLASAEGPADEVTVDGEYSYYKEDSLRPSKTSFGGERDRMEIHTYKFRLNAPLTTRADLDVTAGYETLTGASPWFIFEDTATGKPIQVMSEATIDEQRGDMLVKGNYYFDSGSVSPSAGFSVESDYSSVNFGLGGEWSFNDKNTTISGGAGVSLDWLDPTDAEMFDRPNKEEKQSYTVYGAVSQILTRHSAFQSTFTFGYSEGFLSDPYKRVSIGGSGFTTRDARPEDRMQFTWLNRYRHHVSVANGTLHLDYRLYTDDWSVNSHTFDIAWYQSLPFGFQIIPSFRYYSQSQAEFYELFYETAESDNLYSSDYRLSPYGAISYRLKLTYTAEDLIGPVDVEAALSYERYESSGSFAFQAVDQENPGLVAFRLYAARITVRF